MRKVLYITRNGLMEPLGQSQILEYLKLCSAKHSITVRTFEKKSDIQNQKLHDSISAICQNKNIKWVSSTFVHKPKILAPILGILSLLVFTLKFCRSDREAIVHARSFIPGFVAFVAHSLFSCDYVYDTRGLWLEELVAGNRLKKGSILHRFLFMLEGKILHSATSIVVLTNAVIPYYINTYNKLDDSRFHVIPTCCDRSRFVVKKKSDTDAIISCVGTMDSAWFDINILRKVIKVSHEIFDHPKFEFVTKDNPSKIINALDLTKDELKHITWRSATFESIPEVIETHTMSLLLYRSVSLSEIARSPTRFAELVSSGVGILATSGIGDLDKIISQYRVGEILHDDDEQSIKSALQSLKELVVNDGFSARCKQVISDIYAVEAGASKLCYIYDATTN